MTSIPSQLRNHVDFWVVFRTVLMIVNHLHRLHLPKPTPEQMEGKFLEYQNEIEGLKKRVQDLKADY